MRNLIGCRRRLERQVPVLTQAFANRLGDDAVALDVVGALGQQAVHVVVTSGVLHALVEVVKLLLRSCREQIISSQILQPRVAELIDDHLYLSDRFIGELVMGLSSIDVMDSPNVVQATSSWGFREYLDSMLRASSTVAGDGKPIQRDRVRRVSSLRSHRATAVRRAARNAVVAGGCGGSP
jgi:hypothetical protein